MKKIKLISNCILVTVFCLLLCIISSCYDDKIVNPVVSEELDTNSLYDWNYYEIDNFLGGKIYVADSNNIYITGWPGNLYFNGSDFSPIDIPDPDFSSFSVNGFDKDNIFIGGTNSNSRSSNAQLVKIAKKFATVYPELDSSSGTIGDIQVDGPNEAWLVASERNYVYRFNNDQFTKYYTDPETEGGYIYRTLSQNLFLFTLKTNINSSYLYSYLFENNFFRRIQIDSVCLVCDDRFSMYKSENLLIKLYKNSIFYFSESDWIKICETRFLNNRYRLNPLNITGSSKDHLVCYSYGNETPSAKGIYVWNGSKWSWEKNVSLNIPINVDFAGDMQIKDNQVYLLLLNNSSVPFSILLKGNLKKF